MGCEFLYDSLSPWERVGVRAGVGAPAALTLALSQGERGQHNHL